MISFSSLQGSKLRQQLPYTMKHCRLESLFSLIFQLNYPKMRLPNWSQLKNQGTTQVTLQSLLICSSTYSCKKY
ncbi:hypothetical protein FGO68_gene14903 [Halteria grandinella]|uniref:Uncharacterized protein n=1 Tax=Halteria grandinella TaxID=5974 RepID=A0A8J8P4R1_HALGN|nr:hypothetical protein FGO68_gene14903 [Halteria grandinella]